MSLYHPKRNFRKVVTNCLLNFGSKSVSYWLLLDAHYFHQPVDYEALNLPDYTTIIKHPMDFGTIRTKLNFNAYSDAE